MIQGCSTRKMLLDARLRSLGGIGDTSHGEEAERILIIHGGNIQSTWRKNWRCKVGLTGSGGTGGRSQGGGLRGRLSLCIEVLPLVRLMRNLELIGFDGEYCKDLFMNGELTNKGCTKVVVMGRCYKDGGSGTFRRERDTW